MSKIHFDWVSRKGVGVFCLGDSIEPLRSRFQLIERPDEYEEAVGWTVYATPEDDARIYTEGVSIVSIACYREFNVDGTNLIGKTLPEAIRLLRAKPNELGETLNVGAAKERTIEFDSIGIQVWLAENKKILTVFCSEAMNRAQESFEEAAVWPIKLTLGSASGYSLWGKSAEEDGRDVLLKYDHTVLVFARITGLNKFLAESASLPFKNGKTFLDRFRTVGISERDVICFNFEKIRLILCGNANKSWDLKTCSEVLDSLNMLVDALRTIDARESNETLISPESALTDAMNKLTFVDEASLSVVAGLDRIALCSQYASLLDVFHKHCAFR